jgi:hypothetical protein
VRLGATAPASCQLLTAIKQRLHCATAGQVPLWPRQTGSYSLPCSPHNTACLSRAAETHLDCCVWCCLASPTRLQRSCPCLWCDECGLQTETQSSAWSKSAGGCACQTHAGMQTGGRCHARLQPHGSCACTATALCFQHASSRTHALMTCKQLCTAPAPAEFMLRLSCNGQLQYCHLLDRANVHC